MKFNTDEIRINNIYSLEEMYLYVNRNNVIAQEAMTDYFNKIKDLLNTSYNNIFNQDADRIYTDVNSNKYEVVGVCKRLDFKNAANVLMSKPENFKGFYADYVQDLLKTSQEIKPLTIEMLDKLKQRIAFFINEYKEGQENLGIPSKYFESKEKDIEQSTKEISKYFKMSNGSTKAEFADLYRRMSDIEVVFAGISSINDTMTISEVNKIGKLSVEISEFIDMLIELNVKGGGKIINDDVKKELTSSTYAAAKALEAVAYTFSNIVNFYGVFYNNTNEIITVSNKL